MNLPQDLLTTKEFIYDKHGYECSHLVIEKESSEYSACEFKLNNLSIKFRIAKITPTKIGQFVTIWKRNGDGPIRPYEISDSVDLFIISTRKDKNFGQFIFPKAVLCDHGIISKKGKEGKRAIRVYPPWDKTISKQAQRTQKWQLEYFIDFTDHTQIDSDRLKKLID